MQYFSKFATLDTMAQPTVENSSVAPQFIPVGPTLGKRMGFGVMFYVIYLCLVFASWMGPAGLVFLFHGLYGRPSQGQAILYALLTPIIFTVVSLIVLSRFRLQNKVFIMLSGLVSTLGIVLIPYMIGYQVSSPEVRFYSAIIVLPVSLTIITMLLNRTFSGFTSAIICSTPAVLLTLVPIPLTAYLGHLDALNIEKQAATRIQRINTDQKNAVDAQAKNSHDKFLSTMSHHTFYVSEGIQEFAAGPAPKNPDAKLGGTEQVNSFTVYQKSSLAIKAGLVGEVYQYALSDNSDVSHIACYETFSSRSAPLPVCQKTLLNFSGFPILKTANNAGPSYPSTYYLTDGTTSVHFLARNDHDAEMVSQLLRKTTAKDIEPLYKLTPELIKPENN